MDPISLNFIKHCSSQTDKSPFVKLDNRPPQDDALLLIPAAGGNPLVYRDLFDCLKDLPISIYAVIPKGWDGENIPYQTREEYVNSYEPSLRKLACKASKIHILTWCFGACVGCDLMLTLEIELRGKLFVVEAFAPRKFPQTDLPTRSKLLRRIVSIVRKPRESLSKVVNFLEKRSKKNSLDSKCRKIVKQGLKVPFEDREQWIFDSDMIIYNNYWLPEYAGEIVLVWSEKDPEWEWLKKREMHGQRHFDPVTAFNYWSDIATHVSIETYSGNHETLLKLENVNPIAVMIRNTICNDDR